MMLRLFFLVFTWLTAPSLSSMELNCWDGSGFYRVITVVKMNNRIEVGFQTYNDFFWDITGGFIFDEDGRSMTADSGLNNLYFSFSPEDCEETHEWACKKSATLNSVLDNTVFIEHWSRFDGSRLTKVLVSSMDILIGPRGVDMKITKTYNDGRESSHSTRFSFDVCDVDGQHHDDDFGDAQFPDYLRELLDKNTSP